MLARLVPLLLVLESALPAAAAPPWEMRAMFGGEANNTPFGIGDVGFRRGPLSLQLFTDTLELRWAPEQKAGRWFVALRVEALAAGLMLSPWRDGAPDPARALFAGYGSAEGGWVGYLPASMYLGVQGAARLYLFWPRPDAQIEAPGPTPVVTLDVIAGRYTKTSHVWMRLGLDAQPQVAAPHVALEAMWRPDVAVAPRLELRAAWARNQDFITRTRLGGMNPYVVPLAGAAWAEWWVESYVATRLGLSGRLPLPREHQLELSVLNDLAVFDSNLAAGFAFSARWSRRRMFAEASIGYAPWIPRQEGVLRVSFFALVGWDWGALKKR